MTNESDEKPCQKEKEEMQKAFNEWNDIRARRSLPISEKKAEDVLDPSRIPKEQSDFIIETEELEKELEAKYHEKEKAHLECTKARFGSAE